MYRTGQEIIHSIYLEEGRKVSRPYIHKTLKMAMRKFFKGVQKINPELNPFDCSLLMAEMLGIESEGDYESFFRDFPPDVRVIIRESAKKGANNAGTCGHSY